MWSTVGEQSAVQPDTGLSWIHVIAAHSKEAELVAKWAKAGGDVDKLVDVGGLTLRCLPVPYGPFPDIATWCFAMRPTSDPVG